MRPLPQEIELFSAEVPSKTFTSAENPSILCGSAIGSITTIVTIFAYIKVEAASSTQPLMVLSIKGKIGLRG